MNNPLVSIIIPTYNRAHLIGETLNSVLAQTYTNWECVIVDDGSIDNTVEVVNNYVKKDYRFQYHHRPADRFKGGNAARNYGFELCKGEFVNWFDDDDTMGELFISDKLMAIDENTVIVVGSGYFCDENLRVVKKMRHDYSNNLFEDFLLWKSQIITNSVMIRRNFLLGKKIFEEWIVRGQETEFFSRLFYKIDNEKEVKVVDSFQFYHRNHLDRKSSKDLEYNSENYKCTGFIYLSNYDRVKELQNENLINLFHNRIVSLWFRHLKYGDYENLKKLETHFLKKIKEKKINYLKLKFIFFFCRKLNIQSTKLKNFLKK